MPRLIVTLFKSPSANALRWAAIAYVTVQRHPPSTTWSLASPLCPQTSPFFLTLITFSL